MAADAADVTVEDGDEKTVRWSSSAFQAGFTMIPNVVLLDSGLSAYAHRVYSLLLHYARQDEACWPGQGGLAKQTGCGERSVRAAIRELEIRELLRTKRRGQGQTNVYILLAPRPAPYAVQDDSRTAYGAGLERPLVPLPIEEDAVEEDASSKGGVVAVVDRVPKKVDRKPVTPVERDIAVAVLAEWNRQTGQALSSGDWLSKIVMRIREYPDLDVDGHAAVVAAALARPWWKGNPSPAVVYGNGAIFEKSLVDRHLPAAVEPSRVLETPTGAQTATSLLREAAALREQGR